MSGQSEDGLTAMSAGSQAESMNTQKYSSDGHCAAEQSVKLAQRPGSERVRRAISKPRRKSAAAAAAAAVPRRECDSKRGGSHRRGTSVMLPLGHDRTNAELSELQRRLREAENSVAGVTHDATVEVSRQQMLADHQRTAVLTAEHELNAQRVALSSAQSEMMRTSELARRLEMESAVQKEQFNVIRAEAAAQVASTRNSGERNEQALQHETSKLRGELLSTRVDADRAKSDAWKQDARAKEMAAELERVLALERALRAERGVQEAQMRDLAEQLQVERCQREADRQQMMAMMAQATSGQERPIEERDVFQRLEWQMEQNKQQMLAVIAQSAAVERPGNGEDGIRRIEAQMGMLNQTMQSAINSAAPPPPPPPPPPGFMAMQTDDGKKEGGWRGRRMSAGGTLRMVGMKDDGGGGDPESSGAGSHSGAWKGRRARRSGNGDDDEPSSDDGYEEAEQGGHQVRVKRKEANLITLPGLPPPSQYRGWRINVLREIAAAACRPRKAFVWAERCDNSSVQDEELYTTGVMNETLDAKLASALTKILPSNADLNRRVQTRILADARGGKFTTGRMMLRLVMAHYQTCRDHASLYSINDLLQIRVPSQSSEGLSTFLTNWLWIEQGLQEDIGDELKESLLWNQLKDCTVIATEVLPYRLSDRGDRHHTYEALLRVLVRHVERHRQEKVRSQMLLGMQHAGGGPVAAVPATGTAGEKGGSMTAGAKDRTCWAYARGECTRGSKCRFEHANGGGSTGKGSTRRSASRPKVCNAFQRGDCKYGDKCKFAHCSAPAHAAEADDATAANMREQTPPPVAVYREPVQHACVSSVVPNHTQDCSVEHGATGNESNACVGTQGEQLCACRSWLGDTGAGRDLIGRNKLHMEELSCVLKMPKKCRFNTANGSVTADEKVRCEVRIYC
eukprot:6491365-Amphidinium_carterae.2